MTRARVAVVGAAGFIGRAVMAAAAADGVTAVGFTRGTPPVADDGSLAPGIREAETVVWTAASINPALAETRPDLVAADGEALSRLLTALEAAASPARVVFLSSGGTVYDVTQPVPFTEDSPCAPSGAYGRSKLAAEQQVLGHEGSVVVRIANAYGPGQPVAPGQGVVAHWLSAVSRGEPVRVFGPLDTARDYVYIDDIARALVSVATAASPPRVLNVGSGRGTTLGELLDALQQVTGPVEVVHEESRSFDVSRTWLDVSLARTAVGWVPRVALVDGIGATWAAVGTGDGAGVRAPSPSP